jgi:hypothetical protein
MNDIEKESDDNLGSVKKIEVVKMRDIVLFPAPGKITAPANDIALKSGIDWTDIYFTAETAEVKEERQEDDAGCFDKLAITAKLPYINSTTDPILDEMSKYPLVARVTDANDTIRIYGRPMNPLRLSFARGIPPQSAGYNGYGITISGSVRNPPLFVTPAESGS